MVLVCHECNEKITDLNNGLVVLIRDNNLNFIEGLLVHKENCDEQLRKYAENNGLNANASMVISFLGNEENINYYLTTGKMP